MNEQPQRSNQETTSSKSSTTFTCTTELPDGSPLQVVGWAAKFTPANIRNYGFAVLFFFGISAVIAAWDTDPATLIVIAIVVFGFAVLLLGFERIARSEDRFYKWLGAALVVFTSLVVLLAFAWFIYLAATGGLKAVLAQLPPPQPVIQAINATENAIELALDPLLARKYDKLEVRAWIVAPGEHVEVRNIKVTEDRVILEELAQATVYKLTLSTRRLFGSSSAPVERLVTTPAVNYRLARGSDGPLSWDATYTGPVTTDRKLTATSARIDYTRDSTVWRYQGPVFDGRPHGIGVLDLNPAKAAMICTSAPDDAACPDRCKMAKFDSGALVTATCTLRFERSQWYEGQERVTRGRGRYEGEVGPDYGPTRSFELGPHPASFSGQGILRTEEGEVLDGNWRNSALDGLAAARLREGDLREGVFENGRLKKGIYFDAAHQSGARDSSEVNMFERTGTGIYLAPKEFRFGAAGGSLYTREGLQGMWLASPVPSFQLTRLEAFTKTPTGSSLPPYQGAVFDCRYDETLGLSPPVRETLLARNWEHRVNQSDDLRDNFALLHLRTTDVEIRIHRRREGTPVIRMMFGNTQILPDGIELQVDNERFAIDNQWHQPRAPFIFAKLCRAKKLTNHFNDKSEDITGLCPMLELMLAREYYCRTPGG
jgi:hypothetical protein